MENPLHSLMAIIKHNLIAKNRHFHPSIGVIAAYFHNYSYVWPLSFMSPCGETYLAKFAQLE